MGFYCPQPSHDLWHLRLIFAGTPRCHLDLDNWCRTRFQLHAYTLGTHEHVVDLDTAQTLVRVDCSNVDCAAFDTHVGREQLKLYRRLA